MVSNERFPSQSRLRHPRWRLSGLLLALTGLATQLPAPLDVVRLLGGRGASEGAGGPFGQGPLDAAALTVVAAMVWLMLGWTAAICGAAVLARIPGVLGRFGRAALPGIAPAAIRRVLIAGVGVSVFAGAAACAAQPVGASTQSSATTASPTSAAALPTRGAATADRMAGDRIEGRDERPGTADRGVPFPAGAAESLELDWPVRRPGSTPDVDVDWPGPPATPSESEPPAITPDATQPHRTAPHPATPHATSGQAPTTTSHVATPHNAPPLAGGPHPESPHTAAPTPHIAAPAPQTAVPAPHTGAPHPAPRDRIVIVRPGDSLWELAARDLGRGADDAHIDDAWRGWYAANRRQIGDDPDLILPGQRLQVPDSSNHTSEN